MSKLKTLKTLESLRRQYQIAKEMGLHKNAYWTSIKRSIEQLKKEVK
jgi:hypothetical protein